MRYTKLLVCLLLSLSCLTTTYAQKGKKKKKEKKVAKEMVIEKEMTVETPAIKSYADYNYALPNYDVIETTTEISKGTKTAFEVMIPQASSVKAVEKRWKKMVKKRKAEVEETEWSLDISNTILESIAKTPLTAYAKFKEREEGIKVIAAFEVGEDEFVALSSDSEQANDVERFLTNFALTFAKDEVAGELKGAKKQLKQYNKHLKGLKKQNEKYHEDIAKWKRMIAEAEEGIEVNVEEQKKAKLDISNQEVEVKHVEEKLNVFDK